MRRLQWEKIKVDDGAYESAGVFDINNDGVLDIACGGFWYEGPNWTKHKLCDVMAAGEYFDDFSTIAMDINGDGYLDFVTGGWWGETLQWRENPKGKPVEWKTHDIYKCGCIETTRGWDIDGDGEIEICPNTPGAPLAFYKLIRDKDGKPTGEFRRVQIGADGQPTGHGLGFGDITGTGKKGFIVTNGWWEAPADVLNDAVDVPPGVRLRRNGERADSGGRCERRRGQRADRGPGARLRPRLLHAKPRIKTASGRGPNTRSTRGSRSITT